MKLKSQGMAVLVLSVLSLALYGCAKKADTNKSVEQIKSEVQHMTSADIEAYAQAYVKEITAKKGEVDKVADQLKSISPMELLGEKAKSIKSQISNIESDVSKLTERYQVYAQKYQELGGDASKISIQ